MTSRRGSSASGRDLSAAAGVVQSLLQSQALAKALRPHMAKAKWAEVVGPQIADVTQVERVQNGTELVIRVKNSVWANELVLLKGDMLRRMNKALGGKVLTDLHFKASGLSKKKDVPLTAEIFLTPVPSDEDLAKVRLSAEARTRIDTVVAGIKEEALRGRIRRTLIRVARTEQWKRDHGWRPCSRCATLTFARTAVEEPLICPLCHAGAL
jgi:predicted nucleic acid-binding Zn ribbon protein